MRNLFVRYLLFGVVLTSYMVAVVLVDVGRRTAGWHCVLALGG